MRVVVAGTGVIGLWCARSLAAAGHDVVVVGPAQRAAAATPASAGWVVPALSAPLAGPGVVPQAVRQLLRGEAAFSLTGMSPELAGWLWAFVRSGTTERFRQGLRATLDLARPSQEAYHALRTDGLDFELHPAGLVLVARTPRGLHEAAELVEAAAEAGYPGKNEHVDGPAVRNLEPALADDVLGGVHAHDELHVHPEQLSHALLHDVRRRGVAVREATVRGVAPTSGGWTVETSGGAMRADRVVVAAGYWSREILATLGARLPLQPAAGVSITATGRRPPVLPLKLVEANVAVTPFDGGVRLAGRFALGRPPHQASPHEIRRVVRAAAPYLRSWSPSEISATHVGLRPATPDSLPIIGEVPGRRGVIAATGHGMLGLTLAPGTAAEVLHLVETGAPSSVGSAFAVDRFGRARFASTR